MQKTTGNTPWLKQNKNRAFPVMLSLLTILSVTVASAGHETTGPTSAGTRYTIRDAIVQIYTTYMEPSYQSPWKMLDVNEAGGTGFIIKGRRILTNAHLISYHTNIEIRRHGQWKRYKGRVVHVAHEADLAILTVDDPKFFANVTPLVFGDLPPPQQEVMAYGFPFGGQSVSTSKGILSRFEYYEYAYSGQRFLAGQIDAPTNIGSSGGPVIVDGRVVGVVMQRSDNIGMMVPMPVIRHFFKDIDDKHYDGFPDLGFKAQKMENPGMKQKYGLTGDQSGILVYEVLYQSAAEGYIKKDDVILEIDGHTIADDGTVEFRPDERTSFLFYVDSHQLNEEVRFKVLRQGKILNVEYVLDKRIGDTDLVRLNYDNKKPRYFIYGGIVFSPLTLNYLYYWPNWIYTAPKRLLVEATAKERTAKKLEVVIAIRVLSSEINRGYKESFQDWIVTSVNDVKFKDFNQFYQLIQTTEEPYSVLKGVDGLYMVIDNKKALVDHQSILDAYSIKEDSSPDMKFALK